MWIRMPFGRFFHRASLVLGHGAKTRMEDRMIHKNWAELMKPMQLEVKPGNDPSRQATLIAEPLEQGFGLTSVSYTHLTLPTKA